MSYDVHLHVCFPCNGNEGVAALAREHLALLPPEDPDTFEPQAEARWFLEDLAKRTGSNPGPKGGLSLWGIVGNYTRAREFVDVLLPFWRGLLSGVDGGPLDFEHVVVFWEATQSEQANAIVIRWDAPYSKERKLQVEEHDLPFCWNQV